MDAETVFLGFGNACASAGRAGCKLLKLLHDDATGEEVKRLIEDSHDVGTQLGSCFSYPSPEWDVQLALKIFLTKPAEDVVDPQLIKSRLAFITSPNRIRIFNESGLQS